jgi:hypothetical protein
VNGPREATLRRVPLTVLTVHEIAVGYWGGGLVTPGDHEMASSCLANEEGPGLRLSRITIAR